MSALVGPSGGVLGNLLGGWLSQCVGVPNVFLMIAAGFALASVASWLAMRRLPAAQPS
jgi:hypothetical protein